jgi:hypothetical protein
MTREDARRSPEAAASEARIRREHEELKGVLRRIEETRELGELVPLLSKLGVLLEAHFATEEGPEGLRAAVAKLEPRHDSRLREILEEHSVFLRELERLAESARECLERTIPGILQEVAGLCARLREHEAKENELLLDATYTDIGGGA